MKRIIFIALFIMIFQTPAFANEELCNAVKLGNKALVNKFLANQENMKTMCGTFKTSPLIHWAATFGQMGIVEILLKKGVDPNLKAGILGDETPLLVLLSPNNFRMHPIKQIGTAIMLIAYGADPNAKGALGNAESLAKSLGNKKLHEIIQTTIDDPEGTRQKLLASFSKFEANQN